ncbi:MAG TPA: GLPGLI family protein [Aequorivita sp.]|nr:GLPGLI family protein [Aequorivita sp.]
MKIKKNITNSLILLAISFSAAAQNFNPCGNVRYVHVENLATTQISNYEMTFDNVQSFSKEVNVESSGNIAEEITSGNSLTKNTEIGRKNNTPRYFYNNKSNFYFKDVFFDEAMVVIEDQHTWDWKIDNETKKIGLFTAQKATVNFRGRDYVAWFTSEIPVPFGPWKFKGLPGLILEVYDTNNIFHISATQVKVGKEVDCNLVIDKGELTSPLSIIDYLAQKEKLVDAMFAQISSKLPKGSPAFKRDKNCADCGQGVEIFNE